MLLHLCGKLTYRGSARERTFHWLACRRANWILGALTAPHSLYSQVAAPEWKQAPGRVALLGITAQFLSRAFDLAAPPRTKAWNADSEIPLRLDQAGVTVFVEDDLPIAALERIEREIYLVYCEIGDAARAENGDLVGLVSTSAGRQADVLRVRCDDELQIPADDASHLARASVESLHVVIGQHAMALPRHQALSEFLRRSAFSSSSSSS